MKVILTKEVLGLGDPGEVVQVKNGYGRNYLVPQGMAIEATKKNMRAVEAEQLRIEAAQAREAERMRGEADKLMGLAVTITARAGEGGKLYGSVTNMQIAAAMAELGHDVDRRRIVMEEGSIKKLGTFNLKVKLHPQVFAEIKVTVEPEGGGIEESEDYAAEAAEAGDEQIAEMAEAELAGEAAPKE